MQAVDDRGEPWGLDPATRHRRQSAPCSPPFGADPTEHRRFRQTSTSLFVTTRTRGEPGPVACRRLSQERFRPVARRGEIADPAAPSQRLALLTRDVVRGGAPRRGSLGGPRCPIRGSADAVLVVVAMTGGVAWTHAVPMRDLRAGPDREPTGSQPIPRGEERAVLVQQSDLRRISTWWLGPALGAPCMLWLSGPGGLCTARR